MSIDYQLEQRDGYVAITSCEDDHDYGDIVAYITGVINQCKHIGCERLLVDDRARDYKLAVGDVYSAAQVHAALGAHNIAIAVICQPGSYETGKFFELAAGNRGINIRMFIDEDEAIAWLMKKPC